MDQIKGGVSPTVLDGQILWRVVGEDTVVLLFTLGSRVCSCLSVLEFENLWAFSIFCKNVFFSLCFVLLFPFVPTGGWWQYAMMEHHVYGYTE